MILVEEHQFIQQEAQLRIITDVMSVLKSLIYYMSVKFFSYLSSTQVLSNKPNHPFVFVLETRTHKMSPIATTSLLSHLSK